LADNVHWNLQGKLLLAGQDVADKQEYAACAVRDARVCPYAFKVLRIAPDTQAIEQVISTRGRKDFGSGATAFDLGAEYWIGTTRRDRVARIVKP
jgi:hypothetical protein